MSRMLPAIAGWVALSIPTYCLAIPVPTRPVIGGVVVTGAEFPATGALIRRVRGQPPQYVCTATLITPRHVLTAAHCITPWSEPWLVFGFGADPTKPGREIAIVDSHAHPAFRVADGALPEQHDIAVLVLETAIHDVPPESWSAHAAPEAGAAVTLVGYGPMRADDLSIRIKNAGQAAIEHTSALELEVGNAQGVVNCTGDSGGPSLVDDAFGARHIVGIVSRASDPKRSCVGATIHSRVDAHREFIDDIVRLDTDGAYAAGGCSVRRAGGQSSTCWLAVLALGLWIRRATGVLSRP